MPVPGTGECLLYSFMAGDPVHIRSRLGGLAATDRAAYDWLGDPDAVRGDLRRQAATGATTGPSRTALRAMRSYLEDYVGRSGGRLHPQITGQFRQTSPTRSPPASGEWTGPGCSPSSTTTACGRSP
ncbi:hypothetical protein GCM10023238_14680 [Streptomyces heliomycini]